MKVVAYIRVSTDRQEIGPEVQRSAILAKYPEAKMFEDIGVSGGAKLAARPGLMDALNSLETGGIFVVYRLDRVARDLFTQLFVEDRVKRAGCKFISCTGEGTEGGPEGKLFRQIMGAVAEFEREMIKARTRAAIALKKSKGEKLGGYVRYGYDSMDGKLIPNKDEQAVIMEVMKMRAGGYSIRKIVAELNANGVPTKTGKSWNIRQIQNLLKK